MTWFPDAAAGWRPDPLGAHRLRYWDGRTWTHHVADEGGAVEDPADARRFHAEIMIIGAPCFVVFWNGLALAALLAGAFAPASFLGALGLLLLVGFLWQPYRAVLGLDGTLTYRALVRSVTLHVDDIVVIGRAARGNYGVSDGAHTGSLGLVGGRVLVRHLLRVRPELPAPRSIRRAAGV